MRIFNPIGGGLSFAAVVLFAGSLFAAEGYGKSVPFDSQYKNKPTSRSYRTGMYSRVKEKPEVSEADLLSTLDKEGRGVYNSLDTESKKLARQLAQEFKVDGEMPEKQAYRQAVEEAVSIKEDKTRENQDRMLHNGMDRLPHSKLGT